jgi:hypothetical protein
MRGIEVGVDIGIGDLIITKVEEGMPLLIWDPCPGIRMRLDRRLRARCGVLRRRERNNGFGCQTRRLSIVAKEVETGPLKDRARDRGGCHILILGGRRVGVRRKGRGRGGPVGILLIVIKEEGIETLKS